MISKFFYQTSIALIDIGLRKCDGQVFSSVCLLRACHKFHTEALAVSMAAVFLASKIEECPRRIRHVLAVHYFQFKSRRGKATPPLTVGGRLYGHWKHILTEYEAELLRSAGFLLAPLRRHPHDFIPPIAALLSAGVGSEPAALQAALVRSATTSANDAGRLDLSVRYLPETVACAALTIAAA